MNWTDFSQNKKYKWPVFNVFSIQGNANQNTLRFHLHLVKTAFMKNIRKQMTAGLWDNGTLTHTGQHNYSQTRFMEVPQAGIENPSSLLICKTGLQVCSLPSWKKNFQTSQQEAQEGFYWAEEKDCRSSRGTILCWSRGYVCFCLGSGGETAPSVRRWVTILQTQAHILFV